ncbi:MAG: right-handed parallel beta-helix repeat-containing protein, partial [bacterium]|nr:right-handed parallel beta-helix repeat-containing protein [bacterium]
NNIYNNQSNAIILSDSTNTVVSRNRLTGNLSGIILDDSISSVLLNTITNNQVGVRLVTGSFLDFSRNNLQTNAAVSFVNQSGSFVKVTNNWFGTTVASAIASKISNNGGYSNFTAYRLFGPFDITPGADTGRLPAITKVTAYMTNGMNVKISWIKPADTSDFIRYFVYRSTTEGTTNLSLSSVITQFANVNTTNFIDSTVSLGTNYYYHITALDDADGSGTVYTNESWYSVQAGVMTMPAWNGPFFVDDNSGNDTINNGSFLYPFHTIQRAANRMAPGVTSATTYVFPGAYAERVTIASNRNTGFMVFTALSNTMPLLYGSSASNFGIKITNASSVLITRLVVSRFTNGIILRGQATNNWIMNNIIRSNQSNGIYINSDLADNNYVITNIIRGGSIQDIGISINNGDRNVVRLNQIRGNVLNGINLVGSAVSNVLARNTFCSNYSSGINLNGEGVDNNYVMSNQAWGPDQTYGLYLWYGDNNVIGRNVFRNHGNYGIYAALTATGNYFSHNSVYSNYSFGIWIADIDADNNSLMTNYIWRNQSHGIYLYGPDYTTVRSNRIWQNQTWGIYFENNVHGSTIANSLIYSNETGGIYGGSDNSDENVILGNSIFGSNQNYGIYLADPDRNVIDGNRIYRNKICGISFSNTAQTNVISGNQIYSNSSAGIIFKGSTVSYNVISNNVIYGQNQFRGILLTNASGNYIRNANKIYDNAPYGIMLTGSSRSNVISSNQIYYSATGVYGIQMDVSGVKYNSVARNAIYGLPYGIYLRGGSKNYITNNNRIFRNTTCGIYLNGMVTNNYIAANQIYSNNVAGIYLNGNIVQKNVIRSNMLFGLSQRYGIWITNAAGTVVYNNRIYANSRYGVYLVGEAQSNSFLNNRIYQNGTNGIFINSDTADNTVVFSNNVWGQTQAQGIYIWDADSSVVRYNNVHNNNEGITIGGTTPNSNYLSHNSVYSNDGAGVTIFAVSGCYNYILTNYIWSDIQNTGIVIGWQVNNTVIRSNLIRNHQFTGIDLNEDAYHNTVTGNSIYSNDFKGISVNLSSATNNYICTNLVWGANQDYGIWLAGNKEQVIGNQVYNNQLHGIYLFGATNNTLTGNNVLGNPSGIYYDNSINNTVSFNSITNNSRAVTFASGTLGVFTKNNLQNNSVRAFTNNSGAFVKITNNWFGTTVASSIMSKVANNGGYSNFTPYRLFGRFDITPGADTERLPSVSWMTALSGVTSATLIWNKPADTSDFIRYFVYRSTTEGTTNLNLASVITQFADVNTTNFIDSTGSPGSNYYYHVTSLDGALTYTNESWYSVQSACAVGLYSVVATNTNLNYSMPLDTYSLTNICFVSNDGSLSCRITGQADDFTNAPNVWDVTNSSGFNRVTVEYTTNISSPSWTAVENQEQEFIIHSGLAVREKLYLYIRIHTPASSSGMGQYRSRLRIRARAP